MEHGAKECVEEQSRRETTIAVGVQSAAYIDTEITATNTKEEPGLVELVKSEPGLLVKEEVVEDGWRDIDRQPCLQATYTPAITTSMNVVAGGVVQDDGLNMKEEWADADLDIGPTVLQPMDTPYRPVQPDVSIIKEEGRNEDNNINPTQSSGVKEDTIEDEPRAKKDAQRSNKAGQSKQRVRSQLYSCDECAKTYTSKASLMDHYRNRHSTEPHACTKCNKIFPSKAYLYKHTINAHSEQQYKCAVCKKICSSRATLYMHVYRVHRPRPAGSKPRIYTCDYCKKMFTHKGDIQRHITRVHLSESYKCHQCNKIFKCKEYLMTHKTRVHTAESRLRHTCTNCGQNFSSKWHCQRHEKRGKCACATAGDTSAVASTSRQHACTNCGKNFKFKRYCREHEKRGKCARATAGDTSAAASTSIQHACTNCGKNFKFKRYCREHEKRGKCARATAGNTSAAASTSRQQHNVDIVKEEPADRELDLGPVVFQHMDCNYRPYKQEPQLD